MPYRLRWEGHGVYRRFFGVVSAAEFRSAYEEVKSDIRYEGIRYVISDYLEAEASAEITARDVEAFAVLERLSFYDSPDVVNATVATDERILAGVRHYASLNLSPYPLGIFATVEAARQWIASNPRRGFVRPPQGGFTGRLTGAQSR